MVVLLLLLVIVRRSKRRRGRGRSEPAAAAVRVVELSRSWSEAEGLDGAFGLDEIVQLGTLRQTVFRRRGWWRSPVVVCILGRGVLSGSWAECE